jgi:hypothetical protein
MQKSGWVTVALQGRQCKAEFCDRGIGNVCERMVWWCGSSRAMISEWEEGGWVTRGNRWEAGQSGLGGCAERLTGY